jgi:carbon monoxide dehydrogenase subunit G
MGKRKHVMPVAPEVLIKSECGGSVSWCWFKLSGGLVAEVGKRRMDMVLTLADALFDLLRSETVEEDRDDLPQARAADDRGAGG